MPDNHKNNYRKRERKIARPPTTERLSNVALAYLSKYAASEASLRRVLQNRLRRAKLQHPEFAENLDLQAELSVAIEHIIARHKKTGAINDAAYAETKVNSLRRSGRSARAIQQKLGFAGVQKDVIETALDGHARERGSAETEMTAARELARRRKLGPYRSAPADLTRRHKDLAVMARAGFSLQIARKVLERHSSNDESDAIFEVD